MGKRGDGSIRERRPGVFEIRVATGIDPRSGSTVQRSFYFHGSREDAEARRSELAKEFAEHRATRMTSPFLTVGELMQRWASAPHDWRPSTVAGSQWIAKVLCNDPVSKRRVSLLRPSTMRAVMAEWRAQGVTVASVSGRFRALRAALTWASLEGIIDHNPLREMRGPERPGTRLHVPAEQIAVLIAASEAAVEKATANVDGSFRSLQVLHAADQIRLLVRLAADSGARRGELAALQFTDLESRVLTIERGVSAEQIGPTKTKQTRRLTLAASTGTLWREYDARWRGRLPKDAAFGPWLFSRDLDHHQRLTAGALAHWFTELCAEAGMTGVSLHRLRHTVATFLVRQGDLLGAQHRLGHRDASTTLRNYAHALPLEDEEAADQIERALLGFGSDTRVGPADRADF